MSSPSRAVTTVSDSGRAINWNQAKTPAQDEHADAKKVPALLPTESVQSVLGLRSGQNTFTNSSPVGTSLQLLPPQRVQPAVAQPDPASAQIAIENPPATPAPARMVTRDNAQILGFRKTWKHEDAPFEPAVPEFVLRSPEPPTNSRTPVVQLNAPYVGNGVAPNPMRDGAGPTTSPITDPIDGEMDSGAKSFPVGDRRYFPSFMDPRGGSPTTAQPATSQPATAPENRQPLRDPVSTPNVVPPRSVQPELESPRTGIIGSGVRANPPANTGGLSPVEAMPSLDELDELLPDEADLSLAPVAPQRSQASVAIGRGPTADDGSNEGEGSEDLSDEAETTASDDIEMPNELSLESLLENSLIEDAAKRKTGPGSHDAKADSFDETKRQSVSKMEIKPLKIIDADESLPELQKLESTDREIDLKNVNEDIERLPMGRLSQLDATGRLKSHDEPTAPETISPSIARLKSPVLRTLQSFHARTEHADSRSNWGMMHQIMVYGADTRIIARGRNYSAIAWMAGNNVCRGSRLMTSANGKIQIREGTGLQGHQAQFLAIMSLVGVPSTYPLYVGSERYNMKDLVEVEAAACEEGKELTFTLIGLAHYLDTDTTWAGVGGEAWDFDRLIAAELSQPIVGAACGGTHRLMSFAHALRKRRLEGQPITGQWKRAEDFLNDFAAYTYSLQNRDGSMSTDWFESPQDNGDLKRKVQTTGHMVEFLLTHLPDDELSDPRMTRAIAFLVNAMGRIEIDDSAVGYRGHALRSLAMYHRRMYGIAADYPAPSVANQQRRTIRRQR